MVRIEKKTAKLENVQHVKAVLYRDNYVIGAYSNSVELNDEGQIINDDKPEAGIFVIDLDNYKVYMSDKITSEQSNIMDIYYEDGAVYYSTVRFGDDVTELMIEEGRQLMQSLLPTIICLMEYINMI